MKRRPLLALLALPVAAAGYAAFHPGVTYAKTSLAAFLPATEFAQSGAYTVDPAHTFLGFDIGHLGLSRVQGRFDKPAGTLQIEPKDLSQCRVTVTAPIDSVDTNIAPRDADLRSPNFFDAAKYPELTFASTEIKKHGKGYEAMGNLTIKGVTKPVSLSFKQYGPIKDPWGNTRIGIVADPLVIHRSDFGMTYDADTVSDDVAIHLSLEATQDKPAAPAPSATPAVTAPPAVPAVPAVPGAPATPAAPNTSAPPPPPAPPAM